MTTTPTSLGRWTRRWVAVAASLAVLGPTSCDEPRKLGEVHFPTRTGPRGPGFDISEKPCRFTAELVVTRTDGVRREERVTIEATDEGFHRVQEVLFQSPDGPGVHRTLELLSANGRLLTREAGGPFLLHRDPHDWPGPGPDLEAWRGLASTLGLVPDDAPSPGPTADTVEVELAAPAGRGVAGEVLMSKATGQVLEVSIGGQVDRITLRYRAAMAWPRDLGLPEPGQWIRPDRPRYHHRLTTFLSRESGLDVRPPK